LPKISIDPDEARQAGAPVEWVFGWKRLAK